LISSTALSQDLVITGVVDGPLSGGVPKAIELCVLDDIADLSDYGVGAANNGGGSDGEEFTFPPGPVSAGTFLYVASEAAGFSTFFGFAPDFTSGAAQSPDPGTGANLADPGPIAQYGRDDGWFTQHVPSLRRPGGHPYPEHQAGQLHPRGS
jgi:hypothetical protein